MYKYGRKYNRKRSTNFNPVNKRTAKKVIKKENNRRLRKFVKKVIQNSAEVKTISRRGTKALTTLQSGCTQGDLNTNTFILTPVTSGSYEYTNLGGYSISQGNTDGARDGVQVQVKRGSFHIAMSLNSYSIGTNAVPCPMIVRFYFYRQKLNPNTYPVVNNLCGSSGNFFQDGTSQTAFIGSLADLNMKINNERYTYLGHLTYKLGNASYTGQGASGYEQYFANNEYKLNIVKKINITKWLPKKFNWDDTGNIITPYLLCTVQIVPAYGSAPMLAQYPCSVTYNTEIEFTDL